MKKIKHGIFMLFLLSINSYCNDMYIGDGEARRKGVEILDSIPESDYYRVFCQRFADEFTEISEQHIEACTEAVSILKKQLVIASSDTEGLLNEPFVSRLNKAIASYDTPYSSNKKHRIKKHRIVIKSRKDAEELILISKAFSQNKIKFIGYPYCSSENEIVEAIVNAGGERLHENWMVQRRSRQWTLCYLNKRMYEEHPYIQDLATEEPEVSIANYTSMIPYRIEDYSVNDLIDLDEIDVFAIPYDQHEIFWNKLIPEVNRKLRSLPWDNEIAMKNDFYLWAKTIYLALLFERGNARTARLLLNFMLLASGHRPLEMNNLSDFGISTAQEALDDYARKQPSDIEDWEIDKDKINDYNPYYY